MLLLYQRLHIKVTILDVQFYIQINTNYVKSTFSKQMSKGEDYKIV